MTARTESELQDALDEALAWRRIELSAIQGEVERLTRTSPDKPLTRALIRGGTALVYAHWEGYLKEACQHYLDFVAMRRLRFAELNDGIAISALKDILRRIDSGDAAAEVAALQIIRRPSHARPSMVRKNSISTQSNLRFSVLCGIFERLGLPTISFETKKNFIDKSLCDARNDIAHGRDHYPDPAGFAGTLRDTVLMMEEARALVLAHARTQGYRATLDPTPN